MSIRFISLLQVLVLAGTAALSCLQGAGMPPAAGMSQKLKRSDSKTSIYLDYINNSSLPDTAAKVPIHVPGGKELRLSGWAIDQPNNVVAGGVDVVIDQVAYSAVYGSERSDVAASLKNPACKNSGYNLVLPAGMLAKGPHVLTIRAISHDKKSYYEGPTAKITID